MRLTQMIEALLFASDAPLAASDLCRLDERLDEDTVTAVIDELRAGYDREERSFQIVEVAGGFQLLTRPEYAAVLERFDTVPQPAKLSMPALEVLAIVAYRQPIGRIEIDEIRGVQSSAVLRTLQERELIEPVGRSEGLGRPLLYGTTQKFLEHFGFRSRDDLPRPSELPVVLRSESLTQPDGATSATPAVALAPAVAAAPGPTTEPTPLSRDAAAEAHALHITVPDVLKAPAAVSSNQNPAEALRDETHSAAPPEQAPSAASPDAAPSEARREERPTGPAPDEESLPPAGGAGEGGAGQTDSASERPEAPRRGTEGRTPDTSPEAEETRSTNGDGGAREA